MLRRKYIVFGLLFLVGCCCVKGRTEKAQIEESNSDYKHIGKLRHGWEVLG